MARSNVKTIQRLVALAFVIMAMVAFNLSRPSLQNDLLTSFNAWYQEASPLLQANHDFKQSDLSVKISVSLSSPSVSGKPSRWTLPTRSLLDPDDRANTARILQLISESGVFGLTPATDTTRGGSFITFSVKDGERQFEISVPFEKVKDNIQLKNLLKLLDIYTSSAPSSYVEPARL